MGWQQRYHDIDTKVTQWFESMHWSSAPGLLRLVSGAVLALGFTIYVLFVTSIWLLHRAATWLFMTKDEYEEHWRG